MKKLILLSVLLLLVLAGCKSAESDVPATTENTTEATSAIELPLTKQTAVQLAMEHAGVTNDLVQHLHARRDQDGGVAHYDVDFRHGEYFYAYEISEATGEILKLETEHDRKELPQTQIAEEEAINIALEHEEFTSDSVSGLKTEFDSEDHRYEVRFTKDGIEYIYEICAEFGKILDIDKDRVN
jgi:uncharacterized membrane protein YkoI